LTSITTESEAAHVSPTSLTNGKKEKHNSGLRATSTTTAEIEDDEAGQVKISAHQVGVKRGPSVSDIGLCSPAVARTPGKSIFPIFEDIFLCVEGIRV
jgi:hypothetical protein